MIEVIREQENKLNREVWRFVILTNSSDEIRIKLSSYAVETRLTTRHKFKPTLDRYEAYRRNDYRSLEFEEVPLPDDVLQEAQQKLIDNISFQF